LHLNLCDPLLFLPHFSNFLPHCLHHFFSYNTYNLELLEC
jgi:hypothetical protein